MRRESQNGKRMSGYWGQCEPALPAGIGAGDAWMQISGCVTEELSQIRAGCRECVGADKLEGIV